MSALVISFRAARNAALVVKELGRPELRGLALRMVVSEAARGRDGMGVTRLLAQHKRQLKREGGAA